MAWNSKKKVFKFNKFSTCLEWLKIIVFIDYYNYFNNQSINLTNLRINLLIKTFMIVPANGVYFQLLDRIPEVFKKK